MANKVLAIARTISATFIVIMIMVAMLISISYIETHYKRQATVSKVEKNLITVEDEQGYVWQFEGTNYQELDKVVLKMYNNRTDNIINDDKIIDVIDNE